MDEFRFYVRPEQIGNGSTITTYVILTPEEVERLRREAKLAWTPEMQRRYHLLRAQLARPKRVGYLRRLWAWIRGEG